MRIEHDTPTDESFDYRNGIFSIIVESMIEHAHEVCKNLPEEKDLPEYFQTDSLWKDDDTQTEITLEMKLVEKIAEKVIASLSEPNV